VIAISARPYGQRAVLKFAQYTGAASIAGRFTPGTFTNQITKQFREPRLLVITDPRTDAQVHLSCTMHFYCSIMILQSQSLAITLACATHKSHISLYISYQVRVFLLSNSCCSSLACGCYCTCCTLTSTRPDRSITVAVTTAAAFGVRTALTVIVVTSLFLILWLLLSPGCQGVLLRERASHCLLRQ
jgi:hypothetical protein